MSIATPFQGSLFANDFICDSIVGTPDWKVIVDSELDTFGASVRDVFNGFPIASSPNESQTEDDLIWPVLAQLGWTASLRQQNLSAHGREDVPDGLLFPDAAAKDRANSFTEEWKRYEFGLAVIESKRWGRPLDRRSGRRGEETAPSTQMLRYLRRVDDLTTGKLRWGILTNGARWRLYHQGSRSVSEQFFEMDLAALLDLPSHNEGLFALTEADRRRWLKVFALVFRREAFLAGTADPRTFHQRAIEEGRFYEERVAASLSALVFGQVFPELASAIAAATPDAPLPEVREAALILLYRLLFILYAEDRALLPVRNARYDDYALREKVRGDVGHRKDRGDVFSASAARYWSAIDDLCRAIDQGDASIGLPPYNGGLFDRQRVPLLANIRLGDEVMADAEALVDNYISPLTERIDVIRNTIIDNAEKRGWTIDTEQLDDRHIVRRMILKRCVYGVDKNPMAVELAKVALWLHTFTVGAPLSFLDHHLRCGDSLFGSWVRTGIDKATEQGGWYDRKVPFGASAAPTI